MARKTHATPVEVGARSYLSNRKGALRTSALPQLKSQGMLPNLARSAASFDRPLSEPLCLENAQKRPWSYQAEVECLWLTDNDLELPPGSASWRDQGGALVALKLLQFQSHDLKLAAKKG